MDYDVLILGGGIVGCAIAYELSKYSLNIALIEKEYDIAYDVALINTEIVYDGTESDDSIISKLEMRGNNILEEVTSKFHIPYKKVPSIIFADNGSSKKTLENIYENAKKRGVQNTSLINSEDIKTIEPEEPYSAEYALYTPNTGVICPYDLAIAYGEVAFDNGVNFKLEEEVLDIQKISRGFRIETNKNKFTCKVVINTTTGKNYSIDNMGNVLDEDISDESYIDSKKSILQYFLLDKSYKSRFNNVTYIIGEEDEVFTAPTMQGNVIMGIKARKAKKYDELLKTIESKFGSINEKFIDNFYETPYYSGNVIIDDNLVDKGYIRVSCKHYGQVTMSSSIAKIICETIINNMRCKLKKDFIDKRREYYKFRDLSNEERKNLIKFDKRYGKVICQCQLVTEGEIIDAIRRPLGARTLEGIKRRTGVTLGNCSGSYCMNKIVSILARETNKSVLEIVKDRKNSNILLNRLKEFDGV